MTEVKVKNNQYVFGEDGFKITPGSEVSDEYRKLDHSDNDFLDKIGSGSKLTHHVVPMTLAAGEYYDFPDQTAGYGFVLFGDGEGYAKFLWSENGNTIVLENSTNVSASDTPEKFCIVDHGSRAAFLNNFDVSRNIIFNYSYTELVLAPTFQLFAEPSGVDQLDPYLTINGVTVTPTFRYKGGDANAVDWAPWGYGETLSYVNIGTAPTYNDGSPGLGPNDDSVKFNVGSKYESSGIGGADAVLTEDMVVEIVLKINASSGANYICGNRKSSGGLAGWRVYQVGGYVVRLLLDDDVTTVVSIPAPALVLNSWFHIIWFVDRSGSGIPYVNGVAGSAVSVTAVTGSLYPTDNFSIGANTDTLEQSDSNVAYVAMWKRNAWLDTHLQATVAKERFLKFSGMHPQIANGTVLPTTAERTYPAYIDKVEGAYRKLYYVGSEWLRMCSRQDLNGEVVMGYLPETAATNLIVQSEDFSTWTKGVAGDAITDDIIACPDGRIKAASMAADSTDGTHSLSTSATLTAATYVFSCFAKPGNKNWIELWADGAFPSCYFDVQNGTVGTAANCTGYIEGPFYNGFYRCCIVWTASARVFTLRFYTADADTDHIISDGNGSTPNLYVWGAQLELGDYMTSPVITTGSALARVADELKFVAGDNIGGEDVGQGTVIVDTLLPSFDVDDSRYIYWIGDGTASADRIFGFINTTNDDFQIGTRADGGSNGDAVTGVSAYDNTKHTYIHTYETDETSVYMDGTLKDTDTSADIPDDVDTMFIGMNSSTVKQPVGLLQNLRIYNTPTIKG